MRLRPFLAGLAVAGLLGAVPPARAADTVRLGGVGSMSAARTTDTPTMTLKGLPDDDATFENAHLVRRFAYGVARAATHPFGGYFRPYYHGYGFYRPWFYRPYSYGFYQPWFYRPWSFGYSWPWYGVSYAYAAPAVAVDYGVYGCAPSVFAPAPLTLAQPAAPLPVGPAAETLPVPRANGGFRYDRGPARPVPPPPTAPPPPVVPGPTINEPLAGRPATTRLVAQPKKKLAYPAYGEAPAKPAVKAESTLVKSPNE